MKKFLAVLICAVLMAAAVVPAMAGADDAKIKSASLDLAAEFNAGDVNNAIQMRGFTASLDGRYVYGGFLQGGRYVVRFDTEKGYAQAGSYKPASADNELYCKGLACDDRGYLYVGITHPNNPDIAVAVVDSDMKQIGYKTETLEFAKTGINGVAVQKIGDKYLLYAVTCYDADGVRCYDVTDPADIKLYKSFGVNGVMDYAITGTNKDPSYIAVDSDGYVYLTYLKSGTDYNYYSKGSHVAKISADGKTLLQEAFVKEAYGICEAGDYVFVATFNGKKSSVYALDKSDLSKVGELKYAEQFCDLSDVAYGGGVLYVGDHGDNGAVAGRVLTANLDLTSAEEIIEPGTDKGDMNGDKAIDNKDVVILFRYVSGSDKAEDETVYDFNGDKTVDNKDVVALFRFVSSK